MILRVKEWKRFLSDNPGLWAPLFISSEIYMVGELQLVNSLLRH